MKITPRATTSAFIAPLLASACRATEHPDGSTLHGHTATGPVRIESITYDPAPASFHGVIAIKERRPHEGDRLEYPLAGGALGPR